MDQWSCIAEVSTILRILQMGPMIAPILLSLTGNDKDIVKVHGAEGATGRAGTSFEAAGPKGYFIMAY